jgi:hypothetical protein
VDDLLPACADCNRKRRKEFEYGVDVFAKAIICIISRMAARMHIADRCLVYK